MGQLSNHTDSNKRQMLAGNALIFAATIFFGINVPVMKILIPYWMTAIDVTAWRFIGGGALMWIASLFIHTQKIDWKNDLKPIILSGIFVFLFLFFFSLAFKFASAIDISIIMILPPMMVVAINAIFRHYRTAALEIVGLLVSFGGALLLILVGHGAGKAGSHAIIGDLCALASSLAYALYLIILEKPAKKYKSITLMRWIFLVASILCLPFIWGFGHTRFVQQPEAWPIALIAFTVVFPSFLSYVFTTPAIKMIGSELVSMYQYLVPVIATITAIAMKVDSLVWYQPVAMAIILAGVVLANIAKRKPAPQGNDKQQAPTQQSAK